MSQDKDQVTAQAEPDATPPPEPSGLLPPPPAPAGLIEAPPERPRSVPSDRPERANGGEEPPKDEHPRRHGWLWFTVLVLAILAGLGVFYMRNRQAEAGAAAAKGDGKEEAPTSITAGQSKIGNINIYVDALGTVTPVYTITLYSQVTGQVQAVHYVEGQMVNKGDPLIDIDPRPYQTTLTQAEGTLQHDQAVLDEARMDLKRYQAAWEKNAIPRQTLEDQEKIVSQYEGTVKADQGLVGYDQVQLSYCHIVSPITGRVGLRLVDPGNTVFAGSGSTLVVVTQLQPITVVFNVSEDDLPAVQSQLSGGRILPVDAFDRSDEKLLESGKLTSLDNEVDTTTGTIKFRAEFPNAKFTLFPNQFVNARLLLNTLRNVVLIPVAAVQQNGESAFVYVVHPDNTVSVQPIKILTTNDQQSAVQGLNAGVTVATSGFDRLENGVHVVIRGEPASPQQPPPPQPRNNSKKR